MKDFNEQEVYLLNEELKSLELKLEKLKPILEYYANSEIGELQPDGTYRFVYATNDYLGIQYINYDPRLAKQGLKIIEGK